MKIKKRKKILSLLLTLFVVASIPACNGGSDIKSSEAVKDSVEHSEEKSVVLQESSQNNKVSSEAELPQSAEESSKAIDNSDSLGFPEEWQDNGIFSSKYKMAYELVENMSTEEKVGQLLLARCPTVDAVSEAKEFHIGGYILFGRDIDGRTKNGITAEVRSYVSSQDIPMIIAVDEEGGTVSRLSWNKELTDRPFKSPRELFNDGGIQAIVDDVKNKCELMKELNINTNLAPVCDISKMPGDFMYDRSLGQNPDITADYVGQYTKASQENGISVTLKHFPGYGNNVDTHTSVAVDKRNYETFLNNDFIPFRSGIDAGAHMVLVSHNIVECMDKNNPASLSPKVHEILRNELGFTGIIVTDDLAMDAIGDYVTDHSPYTYAVLAGNDMLCVTDYVQAYNDILDDINNGVIDIDLINHAAMRVLAWKMIKNML